MSKEQNPLGWVFFFVLLSSSRLFDMNVASI